MNDKEKALYRFVADGKGTIIKRIGKEPVDWEEVFRKIKSKKELEKERNKENENI